MLVGRLDAGSEVAQVVNDQAVGHERQPFLAGDAGQVAVQLGLAEVAAVARVGAIERVVHLAGADDPVADADQRRQGGSLVHLALGNALRGGRDRQGPLAELLAGDRGHQRAVDAG